MCENQPSGVQLRAVVGGELLVAEVMKRQILKDVVASQGVQEVFYSTFGKKISSCSTGSNSNHILGVLDPEMTPPLSAA